jgi:hypothetical protein
MNILLNTCGFYAASSSGCLGAVLAQRFNPNEHNKHLLVYIELEDPVLGIIYGNSFPYEPCKPCRIYTYLPVVLPTPSQPKTIPPNVRQPDKFHGLPEEKNS